MPVEFQNVTIYNTFTSIITSGSESNSARDKAEGTRLRSPGRRALAAAARCPRRRAARSPWGGTSTPSLSVGLSGEGQRQRGALVQPPGGSRQRELLKKRVEGAAGRRAGARRTEGDRPRLRRLRESPSPSARTEPAPRPRARCPPPSAPLARVTSVPVTSPRRRAQRPPRLPEPAGRASWLSCPAVPKAFRPDPAVLPGHRRIATARLPAATTSRYNITRHRPQAAGAGACAVKRPQVTVAPQPQAPPRAPGGPTQAAGGRGAARGLLFSCLLCCLIL